MPRTIRDAKLETRAARHRLVPAGRKPYWKTLIPGELHLGYRRKTKDEPGMWLVRRYIGHERYRVAPLGLADDFQDPDGESILHFAEAQRRAVEHARLTSANPSHGTVTVADAITAYIAWLKAHRATGNDAERRANKLIIPALGKFKLTELTTARIIHWRDRLAETPALVRTGRGEEQKFKPSANKRARKSTVNRTLTVLKAALNRSFSAVMLRMIRAWRGSSRSECVSRTSWLSHN